MAGGLLTVALIEAAERARKLENRKTENQKRERKREMGAQRKGQREEGEEEEEGEIQSWCSCHGNRHHLGEEQNRTALGKDPVCERIYTHTYTQNSSNNHFLIYVSSTLPYFWMWSLG